MLKGTNKPKSEFLTNIETQIIHSETDKQKETKTLGETRNINPSSKPLNTNELTKNKSPGTETPSCERRHRCSKHFMLLIHPFTPALAEFRPGNMMSHLILGTTKGLVFMLTSTSLHQTQLADEALELSCSSTRKRRRDGKLQADSHFLYKVPETLTSC